MSIYQEDPFQKIVNVGWGTSWAVLSWRALWKGTLDDPNNPVVNIGLLPIHMFDNPPSVVLSDVTYISGKPPYHQVDINHHAQIRYTNVRYSMTVYYESGPDRGVAFGFIAIHTTGTDGSDYWSNPSLGGAYTSLSEVVFAAGWNAGYSDVVEVSTSTSQGPPIDIYTVEHNALIFIRLPSFRAFGSPSLAIDFGTGLVPFPDETVSPYYKWEAAVSTFSSATIKTFTSVNDVPDNSWFLDKAKDHLKLGDIGTNQVHSANVHFSIDLSTLAVTGSLTFEG